MEKQNNLMSVDKNRRQFSKVGVATPILMTLASQPVFGGACLSNMLSGNLSDPDKGDCGPGWSPGGWGNPVGQIDGMDTIDAWASAGFVYGVLDIAGSGCNPGGQPANNSDCYTGGSMLSSIPGLVGLDGYGGSTSLREIITHGQGTDARHCVTAYLNASLPSINYMLTQQQVIDLCNGTIPVPGGIPLRTFLDTTWV